MTSPLGISVVSTVSRCTCFSENEIWQFCQSMCNLNHYHLLFVFFTYSCFGHVTPRDMKQISKIRLSFSMSTKFQVASKYCLINIFSFYPYQSIIKGGKLEIKCIANFFTFDFWVILV